MSQLLVAADDPQLAVQHFRDQASKTDNPRHREIWEKVTAHVLAELAHDIDATMATLVPNPDYTGAKGDDGPKGYEEVKAYYLSLFENGTVQNMVVSHRSPRRMFIADDVVVMESTVSYLMPGRRAKQSGYDVPDTAGHYLTRRPLLILVPFDADLRICGEISYGNLDPSNWERVSDDQLSSGYLEWVRRYAPEVVVS